MRFVWIAVFLALAGCGSVPGDPDQTSFAAYVGDRASLSLDEVIVGVQDPSAPHTNLHVGLAALINLKDSSRSEAYEVEQIVRRLEPRIASRVVQTILEANAVTAAGLPSLRGQIVAEAQSAFDAAFSKWTQAAEWNVELTVTSLFLTDGSVGRSAERGRPW